MTPEIDALLQVLATDPANDPIRAVLARAYDTLGDDASALAEFSRVLQPAALSESDRSRAAELALGAKDLALARRFLEGVASVERVDNVDPAEDLPHDEELERVIDAPVRPEDGDFLDEASASVAFNDIVGLDDVKKTIERMIVQPLQRPDLFKKYGKILGGGVLLYGPPGCGKTMIARATAGELALPFYNVRIEDIVDPYFGVSEQRLASAFDAARELRPCVLFLDELDSLGYARSKQRSERSRALVEVLLQQLDSIGSNNEGILVLAASNEPWDIDAALVRPGRFDRTIFVPPPDAVARRHILENRLAATLSDGVDVRRLVDATELYSGADLGELVERALEPVIEEALETGVERPLGTADFQTALNRLDRHDGRVAVAIEEPRRVRKRWRTLGRRWEVPEI